MFCFNGNIHISRALASSLLSRRAVHGQPFFKNKGDLEFFQKLDGYYRAGKFSNLNHCPKPFQNPRDRREIWAVWEKLNPNPNFLIRQPEWPVYRQIGGILAIGAILGGTGLFYYLFWPDKLHYKYKHRYGPMAHLSPEVTGDKLANHGHHH